MARNDPGGVLKELDEGFIRRMRNWALLRAAGTSRGFAQVDLANGASMGNGYREAVMPYMAGEADDTEKALEAVPARFRRPVELFWIWQETELTVLATKCGGIDYRTFVARLKEGHVLLRCEIHKRAKAARLERQRIESAMRRAHAA